MQESQSTASLLDFDDHGSSTDEEEYAHDGADEAYAGGRASRSVSRSRSKSPLASRRYSFLLRILRWPVFVRYKTNHRYLCWDSYCWI
jgi:hypothetical protein